MNSILKKTCLGLLGILLGFTGPAQAIQPIAVDVEAFTLNPTLILEMYNVAQQHNNQVTEYPADMNPNVVQVTVNNVGQVDAQPCFEIYITEESSACAAQGNAGAVLSGGLLTTKVPVKAGERKVLTAADFIASGTFNGAFCSAFESEIKADFEGVDPSNLNVIVDKFMKRQFKVCLKPVDCGAGAGSPAIGLIGCTSLTIFTGSPTMRCSTAVLIYPHNNQVDTALPNFIWTPAFNQDCSANKLTYILEVMADEAGSAPIARIEVPAGQTYYQWKPTDLKLEAEKQYWWRVISLDCNGRPFCGNSGAGWNIMKWFKIKGNKVECRYTLDELDKFVRKNANPEIREELKSWLVEALVNPNSYTDELICRMLAGQIQPVSIKLEK